MNARSILILSAVLLVALFISCADDTCTGPQPTYSRSSPEAVLAALGYALEQGDIDIYEECLGSDYWFRFRPEDSYAAGVPPKVPVWERSQDIAAMDSLMTDPSVEMIEARFIIREGYPSAMDTVLRVDPVIKVDIGERAGEETALVVCGSWLYVYLTRDEGDETLWHISGMTETTIPATAAPASVLPCSFGELKAMFRRLEECEDYPRTSPTCLFKCFERSLERMQIDLYDECLDPWYFFMFLPDDTAGVGLPPDAPWWGKTEDVDAMRRLFDDPYVTEVECSLDIVTSWPTEDGLGFRLDPDMRFTIHRSSAPEDTILWVGGSWLDVEVIEDPYEEEKWVFVSIWRSHLRKAHLPGRQKTQRWRRHPRRHSGL